VLDSTSRCQTRNPSFVHQGAAHAAPMAIASPAEPKGQTSRVRQSLTQMDVVWKGRQRAVVAHGEVVPKELKMWRHRHYNAQYRARIQLGSKEVSADSVDAVRTRGNRCTHHYHRCRHAWNIECSPSWLPVTIPDPPRAPSVPTPPTRHRSCRV
jgi:hypothetical protein